MEFFGINAAEALIVGVVALVVIGPSSMPHVARTLISLGQWWTHMRAQMTQVTQKMTQAPAQSLDEVWREESEKVMGALSDITQTFTRDGSEKR